MQTYNSKLTGDVSADFAVFFGCPPAPSSPVEHVKSTVDFMTSEFGTLEYAPDDEDRVVQFCQMVPAGAYGSFKHYQGARAHYPAYTDDMEEAINAAWVVQAG